MDVSTPDRGRDMLFGAIFSMPMIALFSSPFSSPGENEPLFFSKSEKGSIKERWVYVVDGSFFFCPPFSREFIAVFPEYEYRRCVTQNALHPVLRASDGRGFHSGGSTVVLVVDVQYNNHTSHIDNR